jgi:hypothetical protein
MHQSLLCELTGQAVPTKPTSTPIFECPVELYPNILKFADAPTLARCMRVSTEFYKVASKRLYNNVIVKGTNGMAKVLVQHRSAADDSIGPSKSTLLSTVKQLTVLTHTCRISSCDANSLPDICTLLIIPEATCRRAKWLCNRINCPIISNSRPEKVVFHNARRNYKRWGDEDSRGNEETAYWPLGVHILDVKCKTLTLVIDEAEPTGSIDGRYQLERYEGLKNYGNLSYPDADKVRIIVLSKTPAWLDKLAQRAHCKCAVADIYVLATHILAQIIRRIDDVDVYLFRDFDPKGGFLDELDVAIRDELAMLNISHQDEPGTHHLKTLADYISEGVEDELLPAELQYWREENARRLKERGGE